MAADRAEARGDLVKLWQIRAGEREARMEPVVAQERAEELA